MSDSGWNLQRAYDEGYKDGKRDAASPWRSMEDNGPPEEKGPYFVYAPSYRGGSSSEKERARGVMISKWTGKHWMPIELPVEVQDGSSR